MANRVYGMAFLLVLGLAALAPAQTFTVLYNFTGSSDGGYPSGGVIQDPAGNLYGTTDYDGDQGGGVVYEVNTAGTETVLYSFCSKTNCADGELPVTPLARDEAGNIYGTTEEGGSAGYGAVFEIDTAGNETVLYSFTGGLDGCWPLQGLVVDTSGAVFGTTSGCGTSNDGTIFDVNSAGNLTVLHGFTGYPSDGADPQLGHLTMDNSGNLYGTTTAGGAYGHGVLYMLSKNGMLTLQHSFKGGRSDGLYPYGSVAQDKAGNLYGTTYSGGSKNLGTIWKVSKKGKATILHSFAGGTSDGCQAQAGVARDSKGNLYGVSYECGADNYGALYELSASRRLTLLHSFSGSSDGGFPFGELLRTPMGTFLGTTSAGGTYDYGTAWSYVP